MKAESQNKSSIGCNWQVDCKIGSWIRKDCLRLRPAHGGPSHYQGRKQLRNLLDDTLLTVFVKLQNLASSEGGQDLVEYALLVCLIALAAIGGVKHVATAINGVFSNVSTSLA
jgi:pilus assembly protein Flp/PilA